MKENEQKILLANINFNKKLIYIYIIIKLFIILNKS